MLTSHALASKLQKAIIYEKTLDVLCCKSGDLISLSSYQMPSFKAFSSLGPLFTKINYSSTSTIYPGNFAGLTLPLSCHVTNSSQSESQRI